jgi:2-deoxy-D-gluconate 3-dehydrogenase
LLNQILENKRCLVVGGAGSIGKAITDAFVEHGAKVVVVDLVSYPMTDKIESLPTQRELYSIKGDITKKSQAEIIVSEATSKLGGHVEILVNAAGIQRRTVSESFTESDWNDVIAINLSSVFFYSQIVAQDMLKVGYGKIINISSIMSYFGGVTIPAYSASKGGVAQLTKAMSNDWAGRGIRVNAIAPGYIDSPMTESIINDKTRSEEIVARTPIGRWGTPEDLKGIAVFLASRESDFITGAVIPVDGGYSAR